MDMMLDIEKLKQHILDEGERKIWKEYTQYYVAQWCYTSRISFHAFSTLEFGLVRKTIGKFGLGFKGQANISCKCCF